MIAEKSFIDIQPEESSTTCSNWKVFLASLSLPQKNKNTIADAEA